MAADRWIDDGGFTWALDEWLSWWDEERRDEATIRYYRDEYGCEPPAFTAWDAQGGRITDPVTGETAIEREMT